MGGGAQFYFFFFFYCSPCGSNNMLTFIIWVAMIVVIPCVRFLFVCFFGHTFFKIKLILMEKMFWFFIYIVTQGPLHCDCSYNAFVNSVYQSIIACKTDRQSIRLCRWPNRHIDCQVPSHHGSLHTWCANE